MCNSTRLSIGGSGLETKKDCTHVQLSHVMPVRRNIRQFHGYFLISMASGDELPAKDKKEQGKEEVR